MALDYLRQILAVFLFLLWFVERKSEHRWIASLGKFIILLLIVELSGFILLLLDIPNHWIYNLFTLINTWISMTLILDIVKRHRRLALYVVGIVSCLMLYHQVFGPGVNTLDTASAIIGGFFLAGFSAFGLYRIAESCRTSLLQLPEFWILVAYLTYYLCFSPAIGLVNYIAESNQSLAITLLTINDVLFILHLFLIGIGIAVIRKQPNALRADG